MLEKAVEIVVNSIFFLVAKAKPWPFVVWHWLNATLERLPVAEKGMRMWSQAQKASQAHLPFHSR